MIVVRNEIKFELIDRRRIIIIIIIICQAAGCCRIEGIGRGVEVGAEGGWFGSKLHCFGV